MLYICRPQLGENLFATPCWELLSKKYKIYPLIRSNLIPVFKDYSYFSEIIPHDADFASKIGTVFNDHESVYAYHHDDDAKFITEHPEFNYILPYGVIEDKYVYHKVGSGWVSRTRKYMLKLNLMTLEETSNFDCTVRVPEYVPTNNSNEVIVYQGSMEFLRKLPTHVIQKFTKVIPTAIYLVSKETASELKFDERNIRYIITSPCVDENLYKIISLFKSKPRCMIGPDAGLTQLATGYKIPIVWLQSRIPINSVIDIQYKNYKVYVKKSLTCDQTCAGCRSKINDLNASHGVFKVHLEVRWNNLNCRKSDAPSCLNYSDGEIDEIVRLAFIES